MRIGEMNWLQVEEHLRRDDRCIVPTGRTGQHAQLSLPADSILSERVAVEPPPPPGLRPMPGGGNHGGPYQRDDADMLAIWEVVVAETRAMIEGPWA